MAYKTKRATLKPVGQKPRKESLMSFKPRPVVNAKPTYGKPSLNSQTATPQPAAPTAPKPITPQKPEFDQPHYDRLARTDERYTQGITDLEGQEARTKYDFGIDDPTNPFSRVQGLKQAFLRRRSGTSVGLADQGKLYSGTHKRAMASAGRDEAEANQKLRDDYESMLSSIARAKLQLGYDKENAYSGAFEDWLARAPEADVSLDEEVTAPGAPVSKPRPKKPKPSGKKAVVKHVPKKKVKERLR